MRATLSCAIAFILWFSHLDMAHAMPAGRTDFAVVIKGGETTRFAYTASGNVERLTLADDSFLDYSYDVADRLTDVVDSRGRCVHYTLDPLGNRIKEETFDGATLVQVVNRRIDALGRVEAIYGSDETEATRYTYDDTGNEKTITDAFDHVTTQRYDALDRLDQTDVLPESDPDHARIGMPTMRRTI